MHAGQTGKREMFVRGELQRRQSDGKRVANAPLAVVLVTARTERRRLWAAKRSGRTIAVFWSGETGVRVVSPLLLKTSLPRPAPGQAPAGRIVFSIAGSARVINSSGCSGSHGRTRLALARTGE